MVLFGKRQNKYLVKFLTISMNGHICSVQRRVIKNIELVHDNTVS